MVLCSPDGRFVDVNPAFCQMLHRSREDLLSRSFQDVTHPDDLAESLAVIERLRSGAEDAFELEKRYLDSDGQTVWGLVKVRMLRHPDDAPRLMVTHVQDITERMRAERELRLNRDRLKRAQVVGHIGSWEHDPVTRRIWGSEEACRILGVPPTDEDQPVELVEARIHDWPAIRASMLEQLDSRAGYDVALAFNPLDGGPQRILRVVAEMVAVAPEQSERIVGVVEDITEQHETAGALRVAQERLELAVTSSGMGTWDWLLPDGSPVMGQNARRLFGIGAEDEGRLSEQLFSVLHPDDRNRVYEELARAFQMQSEIDTEFRVIWPDGGVHAVAVRGMVYRNAPGTTVRMTGVCWDVTARREAESLLKAHSDRLEQMVDERTRLLRAAQDELVRREKLAVLGQLAGGIGHELRNPLGVISNAVYYLKLTGAARDETGRDYLNIISSEVHTSQKIISDLLGFARTSRAECAAVNLPALVGEVLAGVAPAEGVETALEFPEDLPPLRADPGHVRQMLTNLIVNACQAMPGGGVLSIRARREGPRVRLLVADTGCGMSRAEQARIFEPLYSTKARGIGLGLSVTRNLVEANAGSIEVASEPGRGSTFSVLLPAQEHLP